MADAKISQLTSGGLAQAGDQIPVNRGGANFRVVLDGFVGAIDILWADLLTAIGGSALTPFAWYHITSPPDGSATIGEAWVQAKDENELFPNGMCIINAANITNRLAEIKFFMAGGVGGRIAGVYDGLKNVVEGYAVTAGGTASTANIDTWLGVLSASNQSIKVYGSAISGVSVGLSDYSVFIGATADFDGNSAFAGIVHNGSVNLAGASNANGVYIDFGGSLSLDNGTIFAAGYVGPGKSLNIADGSVHSNFDTSGNTLLVTDGPNASGDTVNTYPSIGILEITDGSADITINMVAGLIIGQRMTIIFVQAQAATTWGGGVTSPDFFPATSPVPYKIEAVWCSDAVWR